ncbi:MAG TPA: response regulator [Stellaceae bacterium]|jgi:DNA-binding response OmpR family regulator|nr:response regulator [Stellaceae bacterium]
MKILLIDDDLLLARVMSRILAAAGHDVLTAHDGERGMALYRDKHPDLVITDIVMPGQEGIETILTLRRDDNPVKIIAISGADSEMLDTARLIGADAILEKPFRAHELLEQVRALSDPTAS